MNKPFNTAKDDLVAGTAGAGFFGAVAGASGHGGVIKGALESVGKEALGALAIATTALHAITSTAYAMAYGCSDD